MKFDDVGIVLSIAKFQENSIIVSCFTKEHGLVKGLVRYLSKKNPINIGMVIEIQYHARLPEHLGTIKYEMINNIGTECAFNKDAIFMGNAMLAMLYSTQHEFDKQETLYFKAESVINTIRQHHDNLILALKTYALFEFELLNSCGFGLDISKCVVTGALDNLLYISPKSGCAVSSDAGAPYKAKLFGMPEIFFNENADSSIELCIEALKITEHFIQQRIFMPNGNHLPEARLQFKNLYHY